ncbi:MAG: Flp family type IVb pilin [Planctomycetales bacterium]|nr:Flp family type IVb pilin [Planctomycetales bacterium]
MIRKIIRFLEREDGPSAVEYAVMLMLVFLACIVVIQTIGQSVSDSFGSSSNSIDEAFTASGV